MDGWMEEQVGGAEYMNGCVSGESGWVDGRMDVDGWMDGEDGRVAGWAGRVDGVWKW